MTAFQKNAGDVEKGTKRIMRKFQLDEISFVDEPAQTPARAVLLKRADQPAPAGNLEKSTMTPEQIAALQADLAKAKTDAEEAKKAGERANAIIALPADQRAYFDGLAKADQDAFLTKSAGERASAVEATKAADAVVYKADDGTEYRKSDSPAIVSMAKRMDAQARDLAKAREDADNANFEKRANDELANLGGDVKARAALLKAAEGIKDETLRTGALACLKSAQEAAKAAFTRKGHSGTTETGVDDGDLKKNAVNKLDELAKAHAKTNNVSYEAAYDAVIQTKEGQELYAASI